MHLNSASYGVIVFACTVLFRHMKVELRQLNFLCSELDIGNVCPACPKVCILHPVCYVYTSFHIVIVNVVRSLEVSYYPWMLFLGYLEKNQLAKAFVLLCMVIFFLGVNHVLMNL